MQARMATVPEQGTQTTASQEKKNDDIITSEKNKIRKKKDCRRTWEALASRADQVSFYPFFILFLISIFISNFSFQILLQNSNPFLI
jgi:hypothetical protein